MAKHKVGVILPTYNRSKWLIEALESLLKQEEGGEVAVHLCLIKNGCTDNGATDKVISYYTPWFEHFDVMHFQDNSFSNIPKAHHLTLRDDFVVEFADDDIMSPGHLLRKCNNLSYYSAPFAYSPARCIDEDGKLTGNWLGADDWSNEAACDFGYMLPTCKIPMSSVVWTKEAFHRPVWCHQTCGGEWPRYLEALAGGDVALRGMDESVNVRIHDGSDTNQRGFKEGAFIDMHLSVWRHWVERRVRISEDVWGEMFTVMANLLLGKHGVNPAYIDGMNKMLDLKRLYLEINNGLS